jgi:hypothetical protein
LALLSVFAYMGKRRASRDPKLSIAYVKKQDIRRERMRKVLGLAHLDRLLTKMQLGEVDVSNRGPKMPYGSHPPMAMRGPASPGMMYPAHVSPALPPHMPPSGVRGMQPMPVQPMRGPGQPPRPPVGR